MKIYLLTIFSVVPAKRGSVDCLRAAAFIFQHNIVSFDVPFHVCPSVFGICQSISNRIDMFHLGVIRIVLDRDFRWDRHLYRAFLLTALQIIGSTLNFLAGRSVLVLHTHFMSKCREFQYTESLSLSNTIPFTNLMICYPPLFDFLGWKHITSR